jgi:hypothetical protein
MSLARHRLLHCGTLALAVLWSASPAGCAQSPVSPAGGNAPAIKHVFVIMLENTGYDTTFGASSQAPYLSQTMVSDGALLRQYYGIGHVSLDNYVALIGGVPPTLETQQDCPHYDDFVQTGTAPDGQPVGTGCIYPASVQTIANQLTAKGLTWKGYMEDMGNDPTRESARCAHGVIGAVDPTERATATDMYAAKHDPFVYFHAVVDSPSCQDNVVPLTMLDADLQSDQQTPNYAFIVPNLCHDGHDRPCKNGDPGGLVSADAFLSDLVPRIMSSPAYVDGGLLIVTFDEALTIDANACCGEPPGPNTLAPGVNGPGGGRIGAVLLSPFIAPGTVSDKPYNHYALLRSVEDIFGLPHLGYAGLSGLVPFGADVYTRPSP